MDRAGLFLASGGRRGLVVVLLLAVAAVAAAWWTQDRPVGPHGPGRRPGRLHGNAGDDGGPAGPGVRHTGPRPGDADPGSDGTGGDASGQGSGTGGSGRPAAAGGDVSGSGGGRNTASGQGSLAGHRPGSGAGTLGPGGRRGGASGRDGDKAAPGDGEQGRALLAVRVLDAESLPMEGPVELVLDGGEAGGSRSGLRTGLRTWAAAGADGWTPALSLAPGLYRLRVRQGPAESLPAPLELRADTSTRVEVQLQGQTHLAVTVVDAADGRPVPGVLLRSLDAGLPTAREARTDDQGLARLPAGRPGIRDLSFQKPGYAGLSLARSAGPPTAGSEEATGAAAPAWGKPLRLDLTEQQLRDGITLRLWRGPDVTGRVLDASRRPLQGALVTWSARPADQDSTGADGGFRAAGLEPGTYRFVASRGVQAPGQASAPGPHLAWAEVEVTLAAGEPAPDVELVLGPGAVIQGHAADHDGRPLAGVQVLAAPASDLPGLLSEAALLEGHRNRVVLAHTDADGSYRLQGLQPGAVDLHAAKQGFRDLEHRGLVVGLESATEQDLVLEAAWSIAGRFVDAQGRPLRVSGSLVCTPAKSGDAAAANAPASGRAPRRLRLRDQAEFRVDGLEQGRYRLDVQPDGLAGLRLDDVAAGTEDLELPLAARARLVGKVVLPEGSPPAQALSCLIRRGSGGMSLRVPVDEQGGFVLDDLDPAVEALVFSLPGFPSLTIAALALEAGRESSLVLRFERGGLVRGRVVDAGGRPVAGAHVMVQGTVTGATTGADGRFELQGVPGGEIRLRVWKPAPPAAGQAYTPGSGRVVTSEPFQADAHGVVEGIVVTLP